MLWIRVGKVWGILLKCRVWGSEFGWSLRSCVVIKCLGDVDIVGGRIVVLRIVRFCFRWLGEGEVVYS